MIGRSIETEEFLTPRTSDYKNPEMLRLEPDYLKTCDYNRGNFSAHQYRRKISELARRLGLEFRERNRDPERRDRKIGLGIFQEIVGNVPEVDQPLVFYEDNALQRFYVNPTSQFQDLDYSPFETNAVNVIEKDGKNLQRDTEPLIIENGLLPTDDNSRVREIVLMRSDQTKIAVVCKRISLTKVRRQLFEEFRVLQRMQQEGLPGPKPIAMLETYGNRYMLMEKVDGILVRNITQGLLERYLGLGDYENQIDRINAKVDELKRRFSEGTVVREDWDAKDLIATYSFELRDWEVVPVDFEKTELKD